MCVLKIFNTHNRSHQDAQNSNLDRFGVSFKKNVQKKHILNLTDSKNYLRSKTIFTDFQTQSNNCWLD